MKGESPIRAFMPFLMPTRATSVIFHDALYDLTKTNPWLAEYNRHRPREARVTVFHLFLWAVRQGLFRRIQLNRFISGGRLYQRRGVWVSFSAKQSFREDAPIVALKLKAIEGEPFADFVARLKGQLAGSRRGVETTVDKELKLAQRLPASLVGLAIGVLQRLDRLNLLPARMVEVDPLYASVFVANLGSIGLDRTYHHLYEWGNVGLVAAMGTPKKTLVVGPDDKPEVRETIEVRWSLDERIADGFYCARSLRIFRRMVEDPARYIDG